MLLVLAILVVSVVGCSETAQKTTRRNMNYMRDDTIRAFGFDQPSALHPRYLVATDAYEPYRGYP
jgi:hypothetical protein